jgi:hypothetical protein
MKDSTSEFMSPQAARFYKAAQLAVFGEEVWLDPEQIQRLGQLEAFLRHNSIFPRDYAYGLTESLRAWVQGKGLRCLPVNMFCGEWAKAHFQEEVGPRRFIPPTKESEEHSDLLYEELILARLYISKQGSMTFQQVVDFLRPMLSQRWLDLYTSHQRTALIVNALDVLSLEHGRYVEWYDDLIGVSDE